MKKRSANNTYIKPIVITTVLILFIQSVSAHVVVGELEKMSKTETAVLYLGLGFKHILPYGLDHILFILGLYLLNPKLKSILLQATAFTLAHSVTLGLSMYRIINIHPGIIEPIIAMSIVYVAIENITTQKLKASRIGIVFLFGLIHGLGFANVLNDLGLPQNAYFSSLIFFNLGVELGQISIILAAFLLFGKWFGKEKYYRSRIVVPISVAIAVVAGYWTIERLMI
ncbi:HupE/UreJ family protein [Ferruginibacter sp. SUN002]|uniref:HupE/UreJ family protein n=1 Tax=Ferruginibacter sp. SUN002 TaxID=2937789 RepID=UPI003D36CC62